MGLPVNLQQDEQVITICKRHPIYVILKGVLAVVIAGLVIWLLAWLRSVAPWDSSLAWWLIAAAVVVALAYIGILYYRYQNDLWIVTNQRLIDALRTTPVNQSISSTDLINVQDIRIEKRGILATVFNFGDVVCQTASTEGEFSFRGVGAPKELMEQLDRLRDDARRTASQSHPQAQPAAQTDASAPAQSPPESS